MKQQRFPLLCAAFVSALCLQSCAFQDDELPCVISAPRACIGEKGELYRVAGIDFDFVNTSAKTVTSVAISCYVYPESGSPDFVRDTNHITASIACIIPPGEKQELSISLDSFIACIPTKTFLVDYFTVTRLVFSDGTSLEDETLKYFTRNF